MTKIIHWIKSASPRQWIWIIASIKLVLFTYYAVQFHNYWDSDMLVGDVGVTTGDSTGYYSPAKSFATGEGYNSVCRMPGVVPIYALFAVFLDHYSALVSVVFVQLLLSIFSVYLLGSFASSVFKSKYIFQLVTLLYAMSTFVSIFDHMLMSDSLSNSFFIFSIFYLNTSFEKYSWKRLLISGFFLAWAVFLRQIFLVVYPAIAFLLVIHYRNLWRQWFFGGLIFIAPLVISIGLWSQYTLKIAGKRIYLTAPIEDCFSTYTLQYQELSGLLIDMGYGEPFWTEGSLPQWMIRSKTNAKAPSISTRHFNSAFNADSLNILRNQYHAFLNSEGLTREELGKSFLDKVMFYRKTYRNENKWDYYVLNRLRHVQVFLFPMRLDNLPGPAFSQMNIFQKAIKLFYSLFFFIVAPLGLISLFWIFIKRPMREGSWSTIPLLLFATLAVVLGFVEQRYFVPIYPFCIIGVSVLISHILTRRFRTDKE